VNGNAAARYGFGAVAELQVFDDEFVGHGDSFVKSAPQGDG
jgi:hypothetical protein